MGIYVISWRKLEARAKKTGIRTRDVLLRRSTVIRSKGLQSNKDTSR